MSNRIQYKINQEGAEIVRCFGGEGHVVLPSRLEGFPVTGIAPYAFSAWRREEDREADPVCGSLLQSIELPPGLKSIGNYAFYDCSGLEEITITSRQHCQIGGGAFTGCSVLSELIVCTGEDKSCLKDILDEVRHEVHVLFKEETKEGRNTYAELYFPEYFEEAVENTPARILETHTHGSGCHYRQCFYEGKPDFKKYDDLFQLAAALENCDLVLLLAFGRLNHPMTLNESSRAAYAAYIKAHTREFITLAAQQEKNGEDGMKLLKTAAQSGVFGEHNIDEAIETASRYDETLMVSYLLNYRLEQLRPNEKNFEL